MEDKELQKAIEEYTKAMIALAEAWTDARNEYVESQKTLIEAGNGIAGFLEEVKNYRGTLIKRTESF